MSYAFKRGEPRQYAPCPCCTRSVVMRRAPNGRRPVRHICKEGNEYGFPFKRRSERMAEIAAEMHLPLTAISDRPIPACVASMGTLCAGHARGNPAGDPCNTDEAPAAAPPIEVDDHDCRANGCTFPRECEGARAELRMMGFKPRMPPMPQQAPSPSALLDVIAKLLPYAESRAEDMNDTIKEIKAGKRDGLLFVAEADKRKARAAVKLARKTLTAAGRKP